MGPSRETAFRVLLAAGQGGYASDVLRQESRELDSRDAGLAEAIAFGCLRYQAQLDYLIGYFSGHAQARLDEEVRIALRMGIFQMRYMERIPDHAAVAESVDLVKRARKRSAAGFVNAVLRKVNRDPVEWPDLPTKLSMPGWLLSRWQRQYGPEAAEEMARAGLAQPEVHVNPRTGRQQDPGSQAIPELLEIRPGMTVLDLCAAPGNKTAQELVAGGRVVACDRSLERLQSVPAEAHRVALDASAPLPFGVKFDRILVDAPCTGTGTLARNPEIKWRLEPGDLKRLPLLQKPILCRALECLKPEGRLVYSTCSLEAEENEEVVAGLPVQETRHWLPGSPGGDGFFAAVITLVG